MSVPADELSTGSTPASTRVDDPQRASLVEWLKRIEQLHAKPIDMGLDRVRAVADRLGLSLSCPVITVGGTNGKGSTCALAESILRQAGYRVGLYTSPHLVDFNERCRIDGVPADDDTLIEQFEAVAAARADTPLTYFEFTTLAALRLFGRQPMDAAILEIGLGGRLDAVNIVDPDCAILTCVDVDHTEFLGPTREAIGWEKAHIFRRGRPAICSDPMPPTTVGEVAATIGADLWRFGRDFRYSGDRTQWSYAGRAQRRNSLAFPALRGANQLLNASGVLAALESLSDRLPVPQQAVRQGLAMVELPGRFQILPGRPAVVLDVAHNPHAAAHLATNLDDMGFYPRTYAVFGMLRDKDIDGVIAKLRDRIDHWLPVDLPGPRAARADDLEARLIAAGCAQGAERSVTRCGQPLDALAVARERASADDRILVFGSFLTVSDVLRDLRGRRTARQGT